MAGTNTKSISALGWVPFFLAAMACSSACDLSLTGVPIGSQGSEADGGPTTGDEDASMLRGNEDASMPTGDASPNEENDAAFFADDFDREDGPISGGPYRVGADRGTPGIVDGRLCLDRDEELVLVLPDGPYEFVRLEVPGGNGLELRASSGATELFSAIWQDGKIQAGDLMMATQVDLKVDALEVSLDYQGQEAQLGVTGRPAVRRPFGAIDQNAPDFASLPLSEAEREQFVLRIRTIESAVEAPCIDNLYVGARHPSSDPFAASQAVSECRPIFYTEQSSCLSSCCKELVALDEATCSAGQNCDDGSCVCGYGIAYCAANCLGAHPSHTVAYCTDQCALQLQGDAALAYLQCADAACVTEPAELIASLVPQVRPQDPPAAEPHRFAMLSIPPLAVGQPGQGSLYVTDFENEPEYIASIDVVGGDRASVFADPSHTRFVVELSRCGPVGQLPTQECDHRRIYTLDLYSTVFRHFNHHVFPGEITNIDVSPSRRYLRVELRKKPGEFAPAYLMNYDGAVLFKTSQWLEWGPDDAYSFYHQSGFIGFIDFRMGAFRNVPSPDGSGSSLYYPFRDKLAWSNYDIDNLYWTWTDLKGDSVPDPVPGVQLRGGLWSRLGWSADALYWMSPNDPVRVATLPSGWAPEEFGFPYAADRTHVLYAGEDLRIVNGDGSLAASYTPSPLTDAPWELTPKPCGPAQGLLSIHHRQEPDFSLSAFKLDGADISVKQLAAVGENQGTVSRPDSCAFLIYGASAEGKTRLYDVATGDDLEYVPAEGQVYWAAYPPRQAYTE